MMTCVSDWSRRVYGKRCLFFFPAEDGIRDLTVTGVQTCALPISGGRKFMERPSESAGDADLLHVRWRTGAEIDLELDPHLGFGKVKVIEVRIDTGIDPRSEERRVGKECRARTEPCQLKNKLTE